MTMILIGMNDQFAVQVADRRLSWDQIVVEEEYPKSFSIQMPSIKLTVAFTGLARIGRFSTEEFLFDQILDIGKTTHDPVELLQRLARSLTHRFTQYLDIKSLNNDQRQLIVSFAGYNFSMIPPLGIAAQITNRNSHDGQFETFFESERRPQPGLASEGSWTWMGAFGNGAALDKDALDAVRVALKRRAPPAAITGRFEKIVRRMSDDHRSASTIGKQLDNIVIFSDPSKPVQGGRSTGIVKPEFTMPGTVMIDMGGQVAAVKGLLIRPVEQETAPLSIPKVHRNQPCPCGSGKRYRDCHRTS